MSTATPTRQLVGDTYHWVAANGHVGGPCNPDQQRAVEAAVTYSIDFDATYGFMAIPSRDDGDIFLLPGNCVAEAEAFAQRIGLRVVA